MTLRTRTELDAFFETGDFPTEVQFGDFIESYPNYLNDFGGLGQIRHVTLTLTSLQILSLNTTPVQLLAAPPVGQGFVPFITLLTYFANTTPYATATEIVIRFSSITNATVISNGPFLAATNSISIIGRTPVPGINQTQFLTNVAMEIFAPGADPTAGDGTVNVTMLYIHTGI